MTTLTEHRQTLRDAIWMHGPEHFDVSELGTLNGKVVWHFANNTSSAPMTALIDAVDANAKDWTACFVGHAQLCNLWPGMRRLLGIGPDPWGEPYASLDGWHELDIDGWCPGDAYTALMGEGAADRNAQWSVAVEWLDRLIKRGE